VKHGARTVPGRVPDARCARKACASQGRGRGNFPARCARMGRGRGNFPWDFPRSWETHPPILLRLRRLPVLPLDFYFPWVTSQDSSHFPLGFYSPAPLVHCKHRPMHTDLNPSRLSLVDLADLSPFKAPVVPHDDHSHGSGSERKKWTHCFENVTALVSLVSR